MIGLESVMKPLQSICPKNSCRVCVRCICCMKDVPQQIETMSRICISAIFQVICAVLFDLPDGTNLSASILSATGCPGYLPCNVGTKKQCLLCQQPPAEHKLRHACKDIKDLKALPKDFLKLVCRVGSMGWDAHDFMVLVHWQKAPRPSFRPRSHRRVAAAIPAAFATSRFRVRDNHPSGMYRMPCHVSTRQPTST